VTYEEEIDHAFVKKRYEKRPVVQNRRVVVLEAFVTNSYIVFANKSKSAWSAKKADFHLAKPAIVKIIRDFKQEDANEDVSFFIESTPSYILLEFIDKLTDILLEDLKKGLLNLDQNLQIEFLPNYELLKDVDSDCLRSNEAANPTVPSNKLAKHSANIEKPIIKSSAQVEPYKVFFNSSLKSLTTCLIAFKHLSDSLQCYLSQKNPDFKLKFHGFDTKKKFFVESSKFINNCKDQVYHWLNEFARKEIGDERIDVTDKETSLPNLILQDHFTRKITELNSSKRKIKYHLEFSQDKCYLTCFGLSADLPQAVADLKRQISFLFNKLSSLPIDVSSTELPVINEITLTQARVDINHNSCLYLALVNNESFRCNFTRKIKVHDANLDEDNGKMFVDCQLDSVGEVNEIIDSLEQKLIIMVIKLSGELVEYFNQKPN
jgi:hypothetical protein